MDFIVLLFSIVRPAKIFYGKKASERPTKDSQVLLPAFSSPDALNEHLAIKYEINSFLEKYSYYLITLELISSAP